MIDYKRYGITTNDFFLTPSFVGYKGDLDIPKKGFLHCSNESYAIRLPRDEPAESPTLEDVLDSMYSSVAPLTDTITFYIATKEHDTASLIQTFLTNYIGSSRGYVYGIVEKYAKRLPSYDVDVNSNLFRDAFYETARDVMDLHLPPYVIEGCVDWYENDPRRVGISLDRFLVNVFDNNRNIGFDDEYITRDDRFYLRLRNTSVTCECTRECWFEYIVPYCFFLNRWTLYLGILLSLIRFGQCSFGLKRTGLMW